VRAKAQNGYGEWGVDALFKPRELVLLVAPMSNKFLFYRPSVEQFACLPGAHGTKTFQQMKGTINHHTRSFCGTLPFLQSNLVIVF
jgi:hypothetical protein